MSKELAAWIDLGVNNQSQFKESVVFAVMKNYGMKGDLDGTNMFFLPLLVSISWFVFVFNKSTMILQTVSALTKTHFFHIKYKTKLIQSHLTVALLTLSLNNYSNENKSKLIKVKSFTYSVQQYEYVCYLMTKQRYFWALSVTFMCERESLVTLLCVGLWSGCYIPLYYESLPLSKEY